MSRHDRAEALRIERSFMPADRYHFDFGECSYARGWAQFDTAQDASYYGTWINPAERQIVNYCEGDVTRQIAATDEAFIAAVRALVEWAEGAGHGPARIDALADQPIAERFRALGLGDILH